MTPFFSPVLFSCFDLVFFYIVGLYREILQRQGTTAYSVEFIQFLSG